MSKRKLFAPLMGAVVLGLSAYAGYRTYDAYNGVSESDLLLANVEALAVPEQPNVDDCIQSDITCIALHPTDPKKDKSRPNAEWP